VVVTNKNHHRVLDALAELQQASVLNLAFESSLEREFRLAALDRYRQSIRIACLWAVIFLSIGLAVQWLARLESSWVAEVLRSGGLVLLLFSYFVAPKLYSYAVLQLLAVINGLLAVGLILVLFQGYPPPYDQLFTPVVTFVMLFLFAMIGTSFSVSLLAAVLICVAANGFFYLSGFDSALWLFQSGVLLGGAVLALLVGQRVERTAREMFLQSRLIHLERDALRQVNQALQENSASDQVTNLLNRRAFEDVVTDAWHRAVQAGKPLYLVPMQFICLDVLNRQQGSDRVDDLLRSVARQIGRSLLGGADQVGRISGSRFCVLYAQADSHEAHRRFTLLKRQLCKLSHLKHDAVREAGVEMALELVELNPREDQQPGEALEQLFNRLVPLFHHS
jgi:diguanylate cyclase (GGDEF)-like protein